MRVHPPNSKKTHVQSALCALAAFGVHGVETLVGLHRLLGEARCR